MITLLGLVSQTFGFNCIDIIPNVVYLKKISQGTKANILTKVISSSRYDHISIFLCLIKREKKTFDHESIFRDTSMQLDLVLHVEYALTGRQNSSNAGLTKVMYCARMLSKSRPRSLISRSTEGKGDQGKVTFAK